MCRYITTRTPRPTWNFKVIFYLVCRHLDILVFIWCCHFLYQKITLKLHTASVFNLSKNRVHRNRLTQLGFGAKFCLQHFVKNFVNLRKKTFLSGTIVNQRFLRVRMSPYKMGPEWVCSAKRDLYSDTSNLQSIVKNGQRNANKNVFEEHPQKYEYIRTNWHFELKTTDKSV